MRSRGGRRLCRCMFRKHATRNKSASSEGEKPPLCCVLDLDQTVLTREPVTKDPLAGLRLYLGKETERGDETGDIMRDCSRVVRELSSEGWTFVAVTARWDFVLSRCRENTEKWLRAHDMEMPVFYASKPYPTDGPRAAFKAEVIRDLQRSRKFGDVVVGVGDRPSDMKAYFETGLRPIVVKDALGEVEGGAEAHLREMERVEARYDTPAIYVESDPAGSAWEKIGDAMRKIRRGE